jgi:hypothetical protein
VARGLNLLWGKGLKKFQKSHFYPYLPAILIENLANWAVWDLRGRRQKWIAEDGDREAYLVKREADFTDSRGKTQNAGPETND